MSGFGKHLEGFGGPWDFIKPSILLERGIKIHYIGPLFSLWVPEPPRQALWDAFGIAFSNILGCLWGPLRSLWAPFGFLWPPLAPKFTLLEPLWERIYLYLVVSWSPEACGMSVGLIFNDF